MLLDLSEVIHLANSKVPQVGVYFANMENHKTMTWIVSTIHWSRTKPAYLFLPPRIMGLISNRLYQYRGRSRFTVVHPRELRELWSPWLMRPHTHTPIRILGSWFKWTDLAESGMVPSTPTGREINFTAWMPSEKVVHK